MATSERVLASSDLGYDNSLDIFKIPVTNSGVTEIKYITHKPVNQFSSEGNVKFRLPGAGPSYVDLRDVYVRTLVRITRADGTTLPKQPESLLVSSSTNSKTVGSTSSEDGTSGTGGTGGTGSKTASSATGSAANSDTSTSTSTSTDKQNSDEGAWSVGPVNNLAHSLWDSVEVRLNDVVVLGGQTGYAYRSMINTLLDDNGGNDSDLECSMFVKDTAGSMNEATIRFASNVGFVERSRRMEGSRTVELMAKLDLDVFKVKKCLINGVTLDICLTPTSHNFRLMTANISTTDYILEIQDISLIVKQVLPSNPILVGHQEVMEKELSRARYFYIKEELRKFSLAKGTSSFYVEDAFNGKIPQKMVIAFVAGDAMTGDIRSNPFNFKHYHINYINVSLSGNPTPRGPLTFDFNSGNYQQCYGDLYRGKTGTSDKRRITLSEYPEGYSLFVVDLAPQNYDKYYPANRDGNARIELRFAKPLPESVVMLVRVSYPSLYEVDYARNIYLA